MDQASASAHHERRSCRRLAELAKMLANPTVNNIAIVRNELDRMSRLASG